MSPAEFRSLGGDNKTENDKMAKKKTAKKTAKKKTTKKAAKRRK